MRLSKNTLQFSLGLCILYIPMTWNEIPFEGKLGFSKDSASSSVGRSLGFIVECQIFLLTFPICYSSLE